MGCCCKNRDAREWAARRRHFWRMSDCGFCLSAEKFRYTEPLALRQSANRSCFVIGHFERQGLHCGITVLLSGINARTTPILAVLAVGLSCAAHPPNHGQMPSLHRGNDAPFPAKRFPQFRERQFGYGEFDLGNRARGATSDSRIHSLECVIGERRLLRVENSGRAQ